MGACSTVLEILVEEKKLKTCQFGSAKWFWPNIFLAEDDAETGKRLSKA
jgi:hypothetical protein